DGIRDRTVTGVQTCALPILEDAAAAGRDAQDQPRFCSLRGHGLSGGSRYVDVVALHKQRNDDHKDDQQHEHYVDERRDINLGLQPRIGTVSTAPPHGLSLRPSAPAFSTTNTTPRTPPGSSQSRDSRSWP